MAEPTTRGPSSEAQSPGRQDPAGTGRADPGEDSAEPRRRPRSRFRSETLQETLIRQLTVRWVRRDAEVVRVSFTAPEGWRSTGFDDVVVLCLADPDTGQVTWPLARPDGVLVPPETGRVVAREYTVRELSHELVLDVVLHESGPGAEWAREVQVGDSAVVVGPRLVRGDSSAGQTLAVGDLTAWPAMCRLLAEWPPGDSGTVVFVLPEGWAGERLPDPGNGAVQVLQVAATGDSARDVAGVVGALEDSGWAGERGFAWVAGESELATGVRRWLVGARGMARDQVQFTGYWRRGHAADQH